MVTEPVNPWDLDEYARDLHHQWRYLASKARNAVEADDEEKAEKYTGKLAYLVDKVVAMGKLRALWSANSLKVTTGYEPESLQSLELDSETKAEFTAEEQVMNRRLNIAKAHLHLADMQGEIKNARELAGFNRWRPSIQAGSKKKPTDPPDG